MKQSEADIQRTIIDALTMDGWLVLRINQGGRAAGGRYTRFAYWQMLGQPETDSGISDILAVKLQKLEMEAQNPAYKFIDFMSPTVEAMTLLAIEVKAPGKGAKLKAVLGEDGVLFQKLDEREKGQARFLFAIQEHGGIGIVADSLDDVAPYLDSVEVQ